MRNFLFAAAAVLTLASCDKDETAAPATFSQATIEGTWTIDAFDEQEVIASTTSDSVLYFVDRYEGAGATAVFNADGTFALEGDVVNKYLQRLTVGGEVVLEGQTDQPEEADELDYVGTYATTETTLMLTIDDGDGDIYELAFDVEEFTAGESFEGVSVYEEEADEDDDGGFTIHAIFREEIVLSLSK